MIVWVNGSFGVGKTTTSERLVELIPASRLFDTEEVGYMLHHVLGPLQEEADFQHWTPWRRLVVETARELLAYTGDTLVANSAFPYGISCCTPTRRPSRGASRRTPRRSPAGASTTSPSTRKPCRGCGARPR
ncbi:hypothetical protein GCM10009837_50220 [Streptomyces durmitorensis]